MERQDRQDRKNMKATVVRSTLLVVLLATGSTLVWAVEPPAFELSRTTIDGGGAMFSTGEGFELSGTIGQPDAGVMTGRDFQLTGGFWFELAQGDCEDDGDVDLSDYDLFTACLTGPGGEAPVGNCRCFDVDASDTVDIADFCIIQRTYTGP